MASITNQVVSPFQIKELIIHTFQLLDLQSLGRVASVCKLFEQMQKENALWVINFGSTQLDRCTLDLKNKKIITVSAWPGAHHCLPAMQYPAVPKGSFVVYTEYLAPCAVIKSRNTGTVGSIFDLNSFTLSNESPEELIIEFKNHVNKPTEFSCFEVVSPNPKSMREGYIKYQQRLVLDILKNANFSDISNFSIRIKKYRVHK
ncbi:MAG TPA: hypothetical protein VIH61_07600 [Waddliaceae bacterium]